MSVQLNHTIVSCRDQQRSAAFLSGILGLPPATSFGRFLVVEADNGVSLDFAETSRKIASQHYAFLVGEEEFDAAFGRIREQDLPTGQILARPSAEPSTTVMAVAACTSKTPMVTCSRSSRVPTGAAASPPQIAFHLCDPARQPLRISQRRPQVIDVRTEAIFHANDGLAVNRL